nr:MAG TPA: hypothetical protein [Caudoviricetes sp.]
MPGRCRTTSCLRATASCSVPPAPDARSPNAQRCR